jgi:hypothetical protein
VLLGRITLTKAARRGTGRAYSEEVLMPHNARTILSFGVLAILPFVWSVASELCPALADLALWLSGPRWLGPYLALHYGIVLLALHSGLLMGFALTAHTRSGLVIMAALPGLWAFLFTGGAPFAAALMLALGYLLALAVDWLFWRAGLAPLWWWPMRLAQSLIILMCLLATALL